VPGEACYSHCLSTCSALVLVVRLSFDNLLSHFTTQVVQRAKHACAQQIGRRYCVNAIIGAKTIEVFNIRKDGYVERTGLQPFEWNAKNVCFEVLITCCSGCLFEMRFIATSTKQWFYGILAVALFSVTSSSIVYSCVRLLFNNQLSLQVHADSTNIYVIGIYIFLLSSPLSYCSYY
jgi:hypothetical protein